VTPEAPDEAARGTRIRRARAAASAAEEELLSDEDRRLLAYFQSRPGKEASATEVKQALGYPGVRVGAVNSHVARLAKRLAPVFSYSPPARHPKGERWWPCLFHGRQVKKRFVWTLRPEVDAWFMQDKAAAAAVVPAHSGAGAAEAPGEDVEFWQKVQEAARDPEGRARRLQSAPAIPAQRTRTVVDYNRNPDVVAAVLATANGNCQRCGGPAPFRRKSDNTPYLEVHHKVRLADGGEDTVANAIALCPNCHRQAHFG
jgi:hypothetical protein